MENTIWKRVGKIASSIPTSAVFTLFSYAEIYVFVSSSFFELYRLTYVAAFFAVLLLALTVCLTLFFGVSLFLALYHKEIPRSGAAALSAELCALLVGAALPILMYYGRMTEGVTFLKTLPYFAAGFAAVAFLFLIPLAKKRAYFIVAAVVAFVSVGAGVAAISAHGEKLTYDAPPVVFDTGKDFSVVWCTNALSVGYIEYEYGGKTYTVYDAADGKYRADRRVHTVRVPYEHLFGNAYTLHSAKVLKNAAKNSKIGAFVSSPKYTFSQKTEGGSLTVLSLTDWHENVSAIEKTAAAVRSFDLVLMMGDAINYVNEFEDILRNIVIPGGKISGGGNPTLFVRGNHEPRGKYASELKSVLGYDVFYYTATYGAQNFIVFDGGEDKPDDDPKNGGLFVSEAYREEELAFMNEIPVKEGNNICLCHIPLFAPTKNDPQFAAFESILQKHNVKFEISGHEHYLEYEKRDFYDCLIAGGPTKENGFVSCLIAIENDVATVTAIDIDGRTIRTFAPVALR